MEAPLDHKKGVQSTTSRCWRQTDAKSQSTFIDTTFEYEQLQTTKAFWNRG